MSVEEEPLEQGIQVLTGSQVVLPVFELEEVSELDDEVLPPSVDPSPPFPLSLPLLLPLSLPPSFPLLFPLPLIPLSLGAAVAITGTAVPVPSHENRGGEVCPFPTLLPDEQADNEAAVGVGVGFAP